MFYNEVVGVRAVGRFEKQEGTDSNMPAIICPMGETRLTNLPKSGGAWSPDSDSPGTAFYSFLLWRDHQLTF